MKWYRAAQLAMRTLRRNPLRSMFMMLGVTVGIAALVAVTSLGEATQRETMRQFKNMVGTFDVINIQPGAATTRGMPSLTTVEPSLKFSDVDALASETDTVARAAGSQNAFDIDVKYRDRTTATPIWGVGAHWLEMRSYFIETGSVISADDQASLSRVAVIGKDVKDALFPAEDPLGKQIRIGNVPFVVKGVLESRGAGPGGNSLDNVLFIPVTTASKRLFNRDYLTGISVQLKDPDNPNPAIEDITAILRERHGIVPPGEDDFTVNNPRAAAERVSQVRSTMATVVTGVAAIAVLIGGAVIMSLMLIAVSERQREIGMRRAVGASRSDVMAQFLSEAAVIATIGGLAGVTLGVAAANLLALQRGLPAIFLWQTIMGAVFVSALLGLAFGLQPAWKAANVDPIEALRG